MENFIVQLSGSQANIVKFVSFHREFEKFPGKFKILNIVQFFQVVCTKWVVEFVSQNTGILRFPYSLLNRFFRVNLVLSLEFSHYCQDNTWVVSLFVATAFLRDPHILEASLKYRITIDMRWSAN